MWTCKSDVGFALTGRVELQGKNTTNVQRWKSTGPRRVRSSAGQCARTELWELRLNKQDGMHVGLEWSRRRLEGGTRCLQPPGWEVRGWWRWRWGEGKGVRNVSTVLPNASKSPWLILHSHSHTPFPWRHHTTCPAPFLEACLLIFQVRNFLPNYLSPTHQSRSTAQLRSLAVPLGLGCSLALSPSSAPSSAEAENNSPHLRALTRRFGQNVKPRRGLRHRRKEQSGWNEPSWGFVLCTQPGLSFTRLRG